MTGPYRSPLYDFFGASGSLNLKPEDDREAIRSAERSGRLRLKPRPRR